MVGKKINREQLRRMLNTPVTDDEVKLAARILHPDKEMSKLTEREVRIMNELSMVYTELHEVYQVNPKEFTRLIYVIIRNLTSMMTILSKKRLFEAILSVEYKTKKVTDGVVQTKKEEGDWQRWLGDDLNGTPKV